MQETQETWVQILSWEDRWSRKCQPTPVFLTGESPWTEEPGGLQLDTTEPLNIYIYIYIYTHTHTHTRAHTYILFFKNNSANNDMQGYIKLFPFFKVQFNSVQSVSRVRLFPTP